MRTSLMRMRSETVISCLLIFDYGVGSAASEPFGKHHALLIVVAERLVEGMDLGVVAPDHELELFDAARTEPILRCGHDQPAVALQAMIGIDGDVIDPAAMAV